MLSKTLSLSMTLYENFRFYLSQNATELVIKHKKQDFWMNSSLKSLVFYIL